MATVFELLLPTCRLVAGVGRLEMAGAVRQLAASVDRRPAASDQASEKTQEELVPLSTTERTDLLPWRDSQAGFRTNERN
ncbi:hypothetical protein Tcan_15197 [Toxocara canis]|uniref:Uncharacterized protein n=1 Tax=Toxocara canis TaxID=6265 RepID=A0A0B2UVT0_TOXCA|nr:hypothetical protein Tcan_15197 [Toxocara canis]